jgi:hypothetical protein
MTEMIILQKQDHGCVYTIDPDSKELYCAPIYKDNTVNLSEFAPVDLADYDDVNEIRNIQKELISLIN